MYKEFDLRKALPEQKDQEIFRRLIDVLADMESDLNLYDRACLRMLLLKLVGSKPSNRPKDPNLPIRMGHVYLTLRWLIDVEAWKKDAAKVKCAKLYGVGRSTVEAYEREFKERLRSFRSPDILDPTAMLAASVLDRMALCDTNRRDDPNFKTIEEYCLDFGPNALAKHPAKT